MLGFSVSASRVSGSGESASHEMQQRWWKSAGRLAQLFVSSLRRACAFGIS